MSPLVSVCLPNLNTFPYLRERADTILAQTYTNWELVVSDNYSEDGAWEFFQDLARQDPRVSIAQAPRTGLYPNWNECVRRARGEYVYIATSDDGMAPDCLEKMVAALERHKECDVAHCNLVVVDENGTPLANQWWLAGLFGRSLPELADRPHVRRAPYDGLLCLLGEQVYYSITELLFRRSLFARIGNFESRWGSVSDFHWYMRVGLVASTVHVPDTWATWRVHAKQATDFATLRTPEHERKVDEMVADALRVCEPLLDPAVVAGLRSRWLALTREMRAYYRGLGHRPSAVDRRLFQVAQLFDGAAARSEVVGRLLGKPRWPDAAPDQIREWLESLGLGPVASTEAERSTRRHQAFGRMKIVHLSCYDINGGAARAAWRIHESLRLVDAQSSMFVAFRESHDPSVQQYIPGRGALARLKRIVRRDVLRRQLERGLQGRPAGFDDFRDDRTIFGAETAACAPDADIYHLHQVTDFVDYRASLGALAARAPVVWTLHEMTPFTGGCHYAYGCEGFTRTCGECPQLGTKHARDLSHAVWTRKVAAYEGIAPTRMHVVGASRWIAAEAHRSSLLRKYPVSVIPYGLDTDIFKPIPEARRLLDGFGLKPSMRIVLFVADWTGSRRKGFDLLDSALGALQEGPETALISLGRGDAPRLQSSLPHVHLGSLTEDRMIAAVYSMADLYVIPSTQDNLPNTVLESMACGTPVVGFRIGGIPDMVRDGESGLLVAEGDVNGLASAMHALLVDDDRRISMGRAGRAIAEREYSRRLQGERYMDLYRSMLSGTGGAGG